MKKLNKEHLKYLNFYNINIFRNVQQVLGKNVWKWFLPISDDLPSDGFRYPTILPYDKIIEMQKETFTHILPDERIEPRKPQGTKYVHNSRDSDSDEFNSDDELV